MAQKFIQHIKNKSYIDFVKETQAILDAQHEKQVQEFIEVLLRNGSLVNDSETTEVHEALTRKHFKLAADSVKSIEDKQKRKELAQHHADIFTKSNPRFDRKKFMQAAGVEEHEETKK
jgi:hypothetical protein